MRKSKHKRKQGKRVAIVVVVGLITTMKRRTTSSLKQITDPGHVWTEKQILYVWIMCHFIHIHFHFYRLSHAHLRHDGGGDGRQRPLVWKLFLVQLLHGSWYISILALFSTKRRARWASIYRIVVWYDMDRSVINLAARCLFGESPLFCVPFTLLRSTVVLTWYSTRNPYTVIWTRLFVRNRS